MALFFFLLKFRERGRRHTVMVVPQDERLQVPKWDSLNWWPLINICTNLKAALFETTTFRVKQNVICFQTSTYHKCLAGRGRRRQRQQRGEEQHWRSWLGERRFEEGVQEVARPSTKLCRDALRRCQEEAEVISEMECYLRIGMLNCSLPMFHDLVKKMDDFTRFHFQCERLPMHRLRPPWHTSHPGGGKSKSTILKCFFSFLWFKG